MRKLAFLMALVLTLGVAGMAAAAVPNNTTIPAVNFNDASAAGHGFAKHLTDPTDIDKIAGSGLILTINGDKLNPTGWATLQEAITKWSDEDGNVSFKLVLEDQEVIPANAFKGVEVISSVTLQSSGASGRTIATINAGAFEGMTGLTSFTLNPASATITELPDNMFNGAKKLSTVDIQPANIVTIGAGAFAGTDISAFPLMPANITRLVTIGAGAFENCPKLANVNLAEAEKLVTIGDNAFSGDAKLEKFIFPAPQPVPSSSTSYFTNQLVTIGSGAFKGCKNLLKSAFVVGAPGAPAATGPWYAPGVPGVAGALDFTNFRKLETIGASAFEGCEEITRIDFTNVESLTTVGDTAFKNAKKLISILPQNPGTDEYAIEDAVLTSFGSNVFYGTKLLNNTLINIKFADGVAKIGANAFWQMTPRVLFRYDTDKPALTTPKALADYLKSLDIVGAFDGANVGRGTIKIADSAFREYGRALNELGIVLENRVENPDTRAIVGTLYRAGFTPTRITEALDTAGGRAGSLDDPTYPITLDVVEDIVKGIIEGDGDYDYDGDYIYDDPSAPGTPGGGGDTPGGGTPGGGGDDEDELPAGGSSGCDVTGFAPLAALLALGLAKARKYRG